MLNASGSSASVPSPPPAAATSRRALATRQRTQFLRHYRDCGDVRQAAASAGVHRSTIYRWRERDARFRASWDSCDDQLRYDLQGRLFALVRDGEKTAVFYKGENVGWRESHTARPVVALLAVMDRERKMRQAERAREEERGLVSHSGGLFQAENVDVSEAWAESDPRKNQLADEVAADEVAADEVAADEGAAEGTPPPPPPSPPACVTSAEEEREAQEWGESVYRAQLAQQEAAAAGRSLSEAHEFVPPHRLVESTHGPHMLPDDSRRSG